MDWTLLSENLIFSKAEASHVNVSAYDSIGWNLIASCWRLKRQCASNRDVLQHHLVRTLEMSPEMAELAETVAAQEV